MNYGKGKYRTTRVSPMNEIYLLLWRDVKCARGVMWFDMAPPQRRETRLGGAICGSCIWLPWRQLAECQQETEVDLR